MGLQKSLLSDYIGITKQLIGLQKKTVGLHLGLQKKTVGLHSGLQKKTVGIIIPYRRSVGHICSPGCGCECECGCACGCGQDCRYAQLIDGKGL